MFIDTHCHIQFEQFNEDRKTMLKNAAKAGVTKCIVPGVDAFSNTLAINLATEYPGVIFPSIGFHPYEASHNPNISYLEHLLSHPMKSSPSENHPVVAIGEIGLDYHLFKGEPALGKKQEQRILFEDQLRLSLKYNLPVIMHCRDAYEDFFSVIDSLSSLPRGVIHCFSGGNQEVRLAKERKFYIGVDGNITYAKNLQSIIAQVPLSMILLETDSPYLTPIPHRGQRNDPSHIPIIATKVSSLLSVDIDTVASQTTNSAIALFDI